MAVSLSSNPSFLRASISVAKQPSKSHKYLTFPVHSSPKNYPLLSLSALLPFSLSSPLLLHNCYGAYGFRCCVSSQQDSSDSLHEAIAREESEEFKEGIVSQEFRRGFLLGDRLLRPAMVKVSSGPGKKEDTAATQEPAAAAGVDEH